MSVIKYHSLIVNDQQIVITIKRSQKAKRIRLQYRQTQDVILVIPQRQSIKAGLDFLEQSQRWLAKQLAKSAILDLKQDQRTKNEDQHHFQSDQKLSVFGIYYHFKHYPLTNKQAKVIINQSELEVNIHCYLDDFHRTVIQWLYEQSKVYFEQKSKHYADLLNVTFNKITVKDTKSRWGSCSASSNLNYSWRLSLAPLYIADYLCAHEVSHLKYMNHSKKFWQTVQQIYPNYEDAKAWLRKEGHIIKNY